MNISKKARILCLLLCLVMVFSVLLTSCNDDSGDDKKDDKNKDKTTETTKAPSGNGGGGNDEKQPPKSPDEAEIEDWLTVTDYGVDGGAAQINWLIFSTYTQKYMLLQHDDSEDPLRSEAYSRTQKIEEMFNVYLESVEVTDCTGMLQASIMGQGGEYDILYPSPGDGGGMMEQNLLTDLGTYEDIHLDFPWWNQSVDTFRIDDRLYFAASDFSICGQGLVGLIYNRDLWKQLQLDYDINQLVEDKEWTMAVLREIVMQYGSDVNGDDIYDLNDQYGMIYQNYHTNGYYWAMGGTVIERTEDNEYYLSIDIDRCSRMAESLYNLLFDSNDKVYWMPNCAWSQFEGSDGWAAYKTGNSLFMSFEFGALFACLQSVPFDLGYAPLPLLDEEQDDYYSLCGAGFFMIPKKTVDPIRNSVILEALCIESYAKFRPTFFHTILLGRLSNLQEDYDMLERLHESKRYDLGYTWSRGGSSAILGMVSNERDTEVASMIRGRWKDMEGTLDFIDEVRSGLYE